MGVRGPGRIAFLGMQSLKGLQYAVVPFVVPTSVGLTYTNPGTSYVESYTWRQNVPFEKLALKQVRIKVYIYVNEATTWGVEIYNVTDGAQVCEVTGSLGAAAFVQGTGTWTDCSLSAEKNLTIRVKVGTATADMAVYLAVMEII